MYTSAGNFDFCELECINLC